MRSMYLVQAITGNASQPKKERDAMLMSKFFEPLLKIKKGLLNNVRWVDATLQSSIHPQSDRPAQPRTIELEEADDSRVTAACASDNILFKRNSDSSMVSPLSIEEHESFFGKINVA